MREQLKKIRTLMAQRHLDAYLIPTTDFHGSEYVNDYHQRVRETVQPLVDEETGR